MRLVNEALRNDRFHVKKQDTEGDVRSQAEKDRDRIIYSSAFRRLAEVTQVISPSNPRVFHNRLTHSLQVAQVGRGIARTLMERQSSLARELEGVDPYVVEAACLAHDLGHPPFGHTAEEELDKLVGREIGGFDGNSQSFRIVTKLAFKSVNHRGLDLTCATLAAVLKYPWLCGGNPGKPDKWGAYKSEERDFNFARLIMPDEPNVRTAEAEIMDWADDVTYSVHDLEDFYRAGRIPLHLLASLRDTKERKSFFDDVFDRRKATGGVWKTNKRSDLEEAFTDVIVPYFRIESAYTGTKDQRSRLRSFTAELIHRYINGIELKRPTPDNRDRVTINPGYLKEVTMLKELTWTYVILAPSLAAQHHGQRSIVRELFTILCQAVIGEKNLRILPVYYQEQIEEECTSEADAKRVIVDLIAGMTEHQTVAMYQRLKGVLPGSGLEDILT